MMLNKAVFVDLDSTLADTKHRQHMIDWDREGGPDWKTYAMACADDTPVPGVARLMEMLWSAGYWVIILSGRDSGARALTQTWLNVNRIRHTELILREPGSEHLHNAEYKVQEMQSWIASHPGILPVLMLDDWPPVVEAMEAIEVPTLLVNPQYWEQVTVPIENAGENTGTSEPVQ